MAHEVGMCFVHRLSGIGIIAIPKNATSMLKSCLLNNPKWCIRNFHDHDHIDHYCVILRDPEERFLSALNMYLTTDRVMGDENFMARESHNEHFMPQSRFIQGLPAHAQVDYFYLKHGIVQDLNDHYGWDLPDPGVIYSSTRIVDTVIMSQMHKLYAADYDLISSVDFINHKEST